MQQEDFDQRLTNVEAYLQESQQQRDKQSAALGEMSQRMIMQLEKSQQSTSKKFDDLNSNLKEEVQSFIKKEFQAREANIETKMEKNKQQFLKAINGNMRILDNLISDYTTRTHDQIKQQLRRDSATNSRSHHSNKLH